MKRSNCYVWTGRMTNLHPILRRWTKLILRSSAEWAPEDCAWWFNERTSVGILSAACWLQGGTALEEFGETKVVDGDDYKGRLDLYLSHRGCQYQVEAKQCWQDLSSPVAELRDQVMSEVRHAVRNVRSIPAIQFRRLGIVFAVPRIKNKDAPSMVNAFEKWREMLLRLDVHLLAWAFPPTGWKMEWENWVYPGVAIVGREA